jgi:hypothetical protein
MRTGTEVVAISQMDNRIFRIAKLAGALDNGLENRRDIGRRRCYYPEDIAAPGLVCQRLGEITGFRLHLVEQPRVLDGDHGLVGKGLKQLDVMICERTGF